MDAFIALADPNRRRIVELLANGVRSAGEIASKFSISASAVSQHLKALREAGLVQVEVRGQQRIYSLAPEGFRKLDDWFSRNTRFWGDRLDRLGEVIAQAASSGSRSKPIPAKPPAATSADSTRPNPRPRSRRVAARQAHPRAGMRRKL
jgi:DNA-binding transcriptional ArsR family regulator